MNHMIQNVSSAIARCKRFIQCQVSNLKVLASTVRTSKCHNALSAILKHFQTLLGSMKRLGLSTIASLVSLNSNQTNATRSTQGNKNIGSDLRFYLKVPGIHLTLLVLSRLKPIKGLERAASRIARSVAIALGISMSLGIAPADGGDIRAIEPKEYVRLVLDKREAICLSRLIGKESAWNTQAIGNLNSPNKNYTYGLLQLKNPIVKDKDAITQIHYGLRYIDHRYQGDTCNAWRHWLRKGWH